MSDEPVTRAEFVEVTNDLYELVGTEAVRADRRHRDVMAELRAIRYLLSRGASGNGDSETT